ncbi:MAG: hypothetical protein ACXU7D_12455, partial [Burkholderiaceae bacterium]
FCCLERTPMQNPLDDALLKNADKEAAANDAPKFGRLLIVLAIAVLTILALTFAAEAYYSS